MRRAAALLSAVAAALCLAPIASASVRAVTVEGVVQLMHADARVAGAPPTRFLALRTTTGLLTLRVGRGVSVRPGTWMRLTGQRRGTTLRVTAARRSAPRSPRARRLAATTRFAAAPAAPNLAVVAFNFTDRTTQPWTIPTITSTVFGGNGSVKNYFAEQSFGKTNLTGSVLGWYTIPSTSTTCDFSTWGALADAQAGAALSGFSHVMYLFPDVPACAWSGLGMLPGPYTWVNGALGLYVMAHELGHNFGAHHSNAYDCTSSGTRVSLSGTCTSFEYGDPFSVMGTGWSRQFATFHKGELGWLAGTSTHTVTASGTYTIAPAAATTGAVQLLRIARAGAALYVDVRRPFGTWFDNFAPTDEGVGGVMIRRGPFAFNATQPALIDATPSTPTFADAPLDPGQTLTDPVTGITITTVSVDASGAVVDVVIPGSGVAPSAPAGVIATPAAGGVDVGWGAATDDGTVVSYRVLRNGVQIANPAGLTYHDTPGNGVFTYSVSAVDDGGLVGPIAVASPVSIGDVTPPTAPSGLAAVVSPGAVTLNWNAATDAVGVTQYRVFRGGIQIAAQTLTTYRDTGAAAGLQHTYTVRAVDAAGNVSVASAPAVALVPDDVPPGAVTGLEIVVSASPWGAELTWAAATDDVAVTGYRVYRDAGLIATATETAYTDIEMPLADLVVYAVAAIDSAGQEGPRTRLAVAPPTGDQIAPKRPARLRATALPRRRVRLVWPTATDNVVVTRYEILVGARVVGRTAGTTLTVRLTGPRGRRVAIGVRAVDGAGNRSGVVRTHVRLR